MKKNFIYLLLTIFLTSSQQVTADIPDDFRTLFIARYTHAFSNESIRNFLGDDEAVLTDCWARHQDEGERLDTILDDYLNDKIALAIDQIVAEILAFSDVDLAVDGWQNTPWTELKAEIIDIHRRDLELDDEADLRGDIADLCEALHNFHNLGDAGDTTFLEIAAYLHGDDYDPDTLNNSEDENES